MTRSKSHDDFSYFSYISGNLAWKKGKRPDPPEAIDAREQAFWALGYLDAMRTSNDAHLAYLNGLGEVRDRTD